MRPPRFWQHGGAAALLLAPAGALYAAVTARRVARPGWRAPVPVLCCGNATAGGAGKTTLALDLGARLAARGVAVAFLTRGYGGRVRGVLRVDAAQHTAALVGDEALLLAAVAPTYVAADRAAGARAAVASGAAALVMDDGLQHPTLRRDLSFLVIDGASGFGNGRVIPAGPLREPIAAAASRCRAAVLIGPDHADAAAALPPALPVLRADLATDLAGLSLPPGLTLPLPLWEGAGGRGDAADERAAKVASPDPRPQGEGARFGPVLAFAGIGRPDKFFDGLRAAGVTLAATRAFPDHHRYRPAEIETLLAEAARLGATPVTTPKDAARLTPAQRARLRVAGVRLVWQDEAAIEALLTEALASRT